MLLKIISKYKLLLFIIVILYSLFISNIKSTSKYNINDTTFVGIVDSYQYKDDYMSFILKTKEKIKCNYYSKNIKLEYGDKLYIKGDLKTPSNNTIPNIFNYKKYLNNNGIYYILEVKEIKKMSSTNNIIYKLKGRIQKRFDKYDKSGYLNAFILGNKNDIDDNIINNYNKNGIIHIFSISGMHISLLSYIIIFILNKIHKSKNNIIIVIIILLFYILLTNFQASILRSVIFFSLLNVFKLKKININNIDTLLLSILFILIIKPNYIYNIGFIYSTTISFTLLYYRELFNKNYVLNIFLISLISFLISLPITISLNYNVNLLSILINIIFVPFITFIIYPLSLLTFIFPFIYPLFNFFISISESLSNTISNISIFNLVIPKLNIITIIIYYLLLHLSLSKNKKNFIFLIIFIFIVKNIDIIDNNYYIYYIDVGQGDMELIKNKNKSIIIDIGPESFNKKYKNSNNYIKFFNSLNINKIDYLIFTHGDYDHMGEAINLVNNFKVEKVIFNCGPYNDLEKELIEVLDKKKIQYYSCIKELSIDKNKLYFLQTKEYDNENDNSNVIYTELNGYKFMFMGDASSITEKEILDKYNLSDIDVLKAGHHGSKTSSGKEFINEIEPKYSIISVGKNNRYGHPNKEVLNNLKDSKIYRTDQDGSIMFKIKNNKVEIETCSS